MVDSIDPIPPSNVPVLAQRGAGVEQPVAHLDGPARVHERRTWLLAEPDDGHLHAAGLDRPLEAGVRLDPVDGQEPVGRGGVRVEVHGRAGSGVCDDDGVHRGADLGAQRHLGHAELGEDVDLPVGGRPTVRPHRGHDERLGAELAKGADRATQQFDPGGESTRTGPDGDRHAGCDGVAERRQRSVTSRLLDVTDRRR